MKKTRRDRLRASGVSLGVVLISSAALATGPLRHPATLGPSTPSDSNGVGFFAVPPGVRPANRLYRSSLRNARPSYAIRRHGRIQQLIGYNSQIQHIVVIYMENRTPENLFGAYWNTMNPATGDTFGADLNVVDPAGPPVLTPFPLEAEFDPVHSHIPGFTNDAAGLWASNPVACPPQATCPPNASDLAYVPTPPPLTLAQSEVANYISLIQNWAYANSVLQSNEGPSFVSHQYAIAGQSGGIPGSNLAPNAVSENPAPLPNPTASDDDDAAIGGGSCATVGTSTVKTTHMNTNYPGNENANTQPTPPPCNEYQTIFDLMTANQPNTPPYDVWQYIAEDPKIIWSGPMAVHHLYQSYVSGSPAISQQPFAQDPDAQAFVANLASQNPTRPFANLTYITPCVDESDHPNFRGTSDGPQWLAWVVNAIGESPYWSTTAIIVTWDDWGGFYDNYTPAAWPFHPANNPYTSSEDPNEWGFRVPFMVISPWITRRGYISTTQRSQGAILRFIEETFLSADTFLNGDDKTNSTNGRPIDDMFAFGRGTPGLPYVPLPTTFLPTASGNCPNPMPT